MKSNGCAELKTYTAAPGAARKFLPSESGPVKQPFAIIWCSGWKKKEKNKVRDTKLEPVRKKEKKGRGCGGKE